jgi:hypothetical protein
MKNNKIKVGDWVKILKLGMNDTAAQVENISGKEYVVVQKEGSYEYRTKLNKKEIRKL